MLKTTGKNPYDVFETPNPPKLPGQDDGSIPIRQTSRPLPITTTTRDAERPKGRSNGNEPFHNDSDPFSYD